LRCSFLGRTHQPVLHYSGSQERTNQFQQPLIADLFDDLREQSVVVDPVEGNRDTLPITSTCPRESPLFVLTIHLKVNRSPFLDRTHRKGRLHLALILPDGSKSHIPADWTDLASAAQPPHAVSPQTATLGSLEDLLHACAVVDALLSRLAAPESENASSAAKEEGILATKSESLRPSSQRNLRVGNIGERPEDSRDRTPRTAVKLSRS
jgi:hypothetical protein